MKEQFIDKKDNEKKSEFLLKQNRYITKYNKL
jgi:hypothetical protein